MRAWMPESSGSTFVLTLQVSSLHHEAALRWSAAFWPTRSCCPSSAHGGRLCGLVCGKLPARHGCVRLSAPRLGQANHDANEEPAAWCPGVDGIGPALELDTFPVPLAAPIDQVLDATAMALRFPDGKSVARTQHFQRFGRCVPLVATAAERVHEDFLACSHGQRFGPKVRLPNLGGDARIANHHGLV